MRKKVLSIVLTVCMLASLFAAPVSAIVFKTTPTVQLQTVSFTDGTGKYPTEGSPITEIKAGEKFAVKISVTNTSSDVLNLSGFKFTVKFDTSAFEPYTYQYTSGKKQLTAGPDTRPDPTDGGLDEWKMVNNMDNIGNGVAIFVGSCEDEYYQPALSSEDSTQTIGYLLLKAKTDAENGSYSFGFEGENYFKHIKTGETKDETVENVDFSKKIALTVTDGALPTLDSVSMKADDEGGLDAVYGQTKHYTLTALSTKGAELSSSVTWSVSPSTAGLSIVDNKLTVSSAAAGDYTVTATPKKDACQGEEKTATFKITPATITNPTVTITGFGKGATVSMAAASVSDGLTYGNDIKWYDEKDVEVTNGNFAGSSTYKAVFTLSADSNHQLAANSTVAVNSVADEYVLSKELTGPDAEGKYTVTLTLKTADKDTLAVLLLPTPSKASYGMTLKDVTLTGGTAMVYGDPNQTPVAGEFRWVDENESVGIPTVGTSEVYGRSFKLKFVPTDNVNYAELETTMRLHVYQATISIDAINNWNYGTAIPYDGAEHTVELVIPDDTDKLYDKLTVDYTNNETNCNSATNVGKYTALAEIKVKAEESAYYAIYESDHTTRTLDWEIVQGTLSAENKTVGVRYSTPSKTLTLAELGLSALANEPGVDISFDVRGIGEVISSAGLTRDAEEKITGISLTLQDTDVNSIGKTGSVKLTITSKNYATKELTVTVEIINKDTKTLTVSGPASFPYGTTAETIKNALTVTGLPTGYDASKVTYTFSNSDISAAAPATGSRLPSATKTTISSTPAPTPSKSLPAALQMQTSPSRH